MKQAIIRSLNVGKPAALSFRGKEVMTGIVKQSVQDRVYLSQLNFEGDGQANLKHHGGVDKAVCVYAHEHYPYWERELNRALSMGAFGENLTTEGLLEDDVCIGDVFQLGEAKVQISQPRQPCFKLSVKYGLPELPLQVQNTGYTGYYFRVLQEGHVGSGDMLTLVQRDTAELTVAYANEIMHHDKSNAEGMRKLLAVDGLSASWRKTFEKRLSGEVTDVKARLSGESVLAEANPRPDADAANADQTEGNKESGEGRRR
ncbi:MOSC domain-containing protein [Paenibacillus sp. J5C_2022]|uniref:MOSC domain-containing protein n=1 Tax=Paenibacillus sp. J5C2022 TaxID=2977129 RepID=UPI0021D01E06|nr:MOSC domain-containing protein [Paenibacillus sp. J5C2022]MCU6709168.1 MOSC domain-containing protein [Paenibacillus sp. J5C2022]